ncbi:DUF1761 domain-containing protein [Verrucosispora sp. WMMA2121]|uniref:DUF1761 domain-containing protein n=1 Tax=Verrucosispora sp. WMMA2121 TaxID=3015164 RepID=UPI0022B673AF|nr:DUF1761 domain-containing protein [Verrucosispora sp. WMMA2121]MCZ7422923.1 DUF1761 domain-containing protein [Verrucosispora sp. WMMA2121]
MVVGGILVATVVAFISSFAFYSVAPAAPATAKSPPTRPQAWQIIAEVLRSAVTATLITGLLIAGAWSGLAAGVLLGLALWALPVVLLTGSVVWENVPVRGAALHAADWLIKLLAIGAIVGAFA